jgi:hypothetical protein
MTCFDFSDMTCFDFFPRAVCCLSVSRSCASLSCVHVRLYDATCVLDIARPICTARPFTSCVRWCRVAIVLLMCCSCVGFTSCVRWCGGSLCTWCSQRLVSRVVVWFTRALERAGRT